MNTPLMAGMPTTRTSGFAPHFGYRLTIQPMLIRPFAA